MDRSLKLIFPTMLGLSLFISGCDDSFCNPPAARTEDLPLPDQTVVASRVSQMQLVGQGADKELSYKAPARGQLIVFDQDSGQFIYHGTMIKGEMFLFEPASSRAQINKQTVDLDHITNERDEYRLYFVPQ